MPPELGWYAVFAAGSSEEVSQKGKEKAKDEAERDTDVLSLGEKEKERPQYISACQKTGQKEKAKVRKARARKDCPSMVRTEKKGLARPM